MTKFNKNLIYNSLLDKYNDIIEYKGSIWFVTNKGVYKNTNNQLVAVSLKENLAKFITVEGQLFIWTIYGEFFKLKENKLIPMPFNRLVSKRLKNKIINSVVYSNKNFWISTVIGGSIVKIDQTKEEIKTIELQPDYPYYVAQFGDAFVSGNNAHPTKKELAIEFKKKSFQIPLAENLSFSKTNVIKLNDGTFIFTRQF